MRHLAGGVLVGVLLGVAGLVFGLPGMTAALLIVAGAGIVSRMPMLAAGGLIGLGAAWLVLFARVAVLCGQPEQQCGATPADITPWLAVSGAVTVAGVIIGAFALSRARERG